MKLLVAWARRDSFHLCRFELFITLVLQDHLFNPAWRISIHKDSFTRLAHLKYLVLVHGAEDELFSSHVFDQPLGLHDVKHFTNLFFSKSVDEVYFVEVDENCVLASLGKGTGDLAFMHLHQAFNYTIILSG